jgi:hypothetical protein
MFIIKYDNDLSKYTKVGRKDRIVCLCFITFANNMDPFFNVCFHVYCKYNSLLFHIFLLIFVFVSISVQLYGNSSIHVRSHCTYLKEEKRIPVKLGVVAPLDPARHLHSYKVQPMDISIRHLRIFTTYFI